jgi:hypothetical protein
MTVIEKYTKVTIKHFKLLLRCKPPEQALTDNKMHNEKRKSDSLLIKLKNINSRTSLLSSLHITNNPYCICRRSE